MRPTCSVGRPVHGEYVAERARPLSITAVTPSTVTELSATLVARMSSSFCGRQNSAVLLGGRELAVQWKHEQAGVAGDGFAFALRPANLRGSGKECKDVAGMALAQEKLDRGFHLDM